MTKTSKFGGTSLADAGRFRNVANIIRSDKTRRYIVVSAPGVRFEGDEKITDLLLSAGRSTFCLEKVRERFCEIAVDLGLDIDIASEIKTIEKNINNGAKTDYIISRGEYLTAKILAQLLGYTFVDAADIISFNGGILSAQETERLASARLSKLDYAVIPGFYGSDELGKIRAFSRGGSDYSGAIIANATKSTEYENWTDVDGFRATDPKILKTAKRIQYLSYDEAYTLASMGASVLHPSTVLPLKKRRIKLIIKNTFNPICEGTIIAESSEKREDSLAGISVKSLCKLVAIDNLKMDEVIKKDALFAEIIAKNASFERDITLLTLVGYRGDDLLARAKTTIERTAKICLILSPSESELLIGIEPNCDLRNTLENLYNEFFNETN